MVDPQEEITERRPTNYSRWHREALPEWCYMTDGDWFEQRVIEGELKAVAYIETIEIEKPGEGNKSHPLWKSKRALCLEIERKMGIPAYVVWHNAACNDFLVQRITETNPRRMNKEEYIEFIKNL